MVDLNVSLTKNIRNSQEIPELKKASTQKDGKDPVCYEGNPDFKTRLSEILYYPEKATKLLWRGQDDPKGWSPLAGVTPPAQAKPSFGWMEYLFPPHPHVGGCLLSTPLPHDELTGTETYRVIEEMRNSLRES